MEVGITRSFFFFSSRRRHTRVDCGWSSDVCSSDLHDGAQQRLVTLAVLLRMASDRVESEPAAARTLLQGATEQLEQRSEERRVGKEWRSRVEPDSEKSKQNEQEDRKDS